MVVKKTRAKVAKGGCLVGLKGVAKGCKVGRTAPHNVGKEKSTLSKVMKRKAPKKVAKKPKRMTARELQEHNEMERRKKYPNESALRRSARKAKKVAKK